MIGPIPPDPTIAEKADQDAHATFMKALPLAVLLAQGAVADTAIIIIVLNT